MSAPFWSVFQSAPVRKTRALAGSPCCLSFILSFFLSFSLPLFLSFSLSLSFSFSFSSSLSFSVFLSVERALSAPFWSVCQSVRHELTEFKGAAKRKTRGGHRVQGRGQEEDKAQPQSPATELTEFRGAAKRRTRGGQGPATEPSHRVDRVRPRGGQEEDKAQPRSPATELTEFRGAAKRTTRGGQGPATELTGFRGAAKRRTLSLFLSALEIAGCLLEHVLISCLGMLLLDGQKLCNDTCSGGLLPNCSLLWEIGGWCFMD